jgi:hypothetical protein
MANAGRIKVGPVAGAATPLGVDAAGEADWLLLVPAAAPELPPALFATHLPE